MKRFALGLLLILAVMLLSTAAAQNEWIPEEVASSVSVVPEWNEPDTPLLAMTRADGLIYFADIDEPMQEFLQTQARCIFEALRPSQLIRRLSRITELDLCSCPGRLQDMRWLWMFTNLTSISLTDAQVDDLHIIAGFADLESLTLVNCGLFDLTPLTDCKKLSALAIGWDDVYPGAAGAFDLTPLQNMKKLRSLALYGSGIQSLEPLDSISRQFRVLTLSDVASEDFSVLKDFLNLNTLTLDLLHSSYAADILLACPRDIKTLTLQRLIINDTVTQALQRYKKLTDYTIADCDMTNPLFFEDLNKASTLTLQSLSMEGGGWIEEVIATKKSMILSDTPDAVMINMLDTRSPNLTTLTMDIQSLNAPLCEALQKKTSLNYVTIRLQNDMDLTSDVWKRISGIRNLTIASQGHTLLSTDFLYNLSYINTLTLSGLQVDNTAGIPALERLSQLNVYGCRIGDWSFLADLNALTTVKIYKSGLTNETLPLLAALRGLDELRLDGNQITDLTPLLAAPTLRKLSILNNPIADYSVLLDMPAMRTVFLDEGGIITGNYILARSVYVDTVDYEAIYQAAFGDPAPQP